MPSNPDATHFFQATIEIIGINPFVFVPTAILEDIFKAAGKNKGPIPIQGTVNGEPYTQTLMKYAGHWRLYINMFMLKNSPQRVGEVIDITVAFDPKDRIIAPHPKLVSALEGNPDAQKVFNGLSPSRQKEIVRYFTFLKTEESLDRNIARAIDFLLGKGRFVGRDKP